MTMRRAALATALAAALAAPAGAQQRYWYDGAQRRPLWVEPSVLAEFSGPRAEKSQVVKPAALVKSPQAASPVFRDATGRPRALPGGVMLRFREGTPEAGRAALLARHGLGAARELGEGSGTWLVDTPPGTTALDLANRLFESGDFAAAAPNWWQPRTLK